MYTGVLIFPEEYIVFISVSLAGWVVYMTLAEILYFYMKCPTD